MAAPGSSGGHTINGMPDSSQVLASLMASMAGTVGPSHSSHGSGTNTNGQLPPHQTPAYMQPMQSMPQQMLNMGFFGMPTGMQMPMYQQQTQGPAPMMMAVFAEVMRLSKPVGSEHDEKILVDTLSESEAKGWTYKTALESLHAINEHASSLWKDYYLDHKTRLDALIEKKRSFGQSSKSKGKGKGKAKEGKRHDSPAPNRPPHKERETSYSGPKPPKPQVLPGGNCRVTESDLEFMMEFINYRANKKFTQEYTTYASALAKRAPHHSVAVWRAQMTKHTEEIQEILLDVKDQYRREGRMCSPSPSNSDERNEEHQSSDYSEDDEYEDKEDDEYEASGDSDSDEEDDLQMMSRAGDRITDADRRVMARHIATFGEDWDRAGSTKARWEPFAEVFAQRSVGAWAEAYRNHKDRIDPLVEKYLRRTRRETRTSSRHPSSWSNKAKSKKRKSHGDDEGYNKSHRRRYTYA